MSKLGLSFLEGNGLDLLELIEVHHEHLPLWAENQEGVVVVNECFFLHYFMFQHLFLVLLIQES